MCTLREECQCFKDGYEQGESDGISKGYLDKEIEITERLEEWKHPGQQKAIIYKDETKKPKKYFKKLWGWLR